MKNFLCSVDRERGTFGQVEVTWQVVDADNGLFVPPGNDLQSTSGVLVFNDTVSQSSIEVSVITDGKPELAEKYVIELTAVTGGGPPGPGARLSSTQTQANLTVLKNDDANGVLSFDSGSLGTYLPEDVESTGVLPGSVNVTVVRDKGLFGSVEVLQCSSWLLHVCVLYYCTLHRYLGISFQAVFQTWPASLICCLKSMLDLE